MNRYLLLFTIILSAIHMAIAQQSSIEGSWRSETKEPNTIIFNHDGTGSDENGQFTWMVEADQITLSARDQKETYHYYINGGRLFLVNTETQQTKTFTDASKNNKREEYSDPALLIGTWEGNNSKLQINNDGSAVMNNISYDYRASNKKFILISKDSSEEFNYSVNDMTLTLSNKKGTFSYTKK